MYYSDYINENPYYEYGQENEFIEQPNDYAYEEEPVDIPNEYSDSESSEDEDPSKWDPKLQALKNLIAEGKITLEDENEEKPKLKPSDGEKEQKLQLIKINGKEVYALENKKGELIYVDGTRIKKIKNIPMLNDDGSYTISDKNKQTFRQLLVDSIAADGWATIRKILKKIDKNKALKLYKTCLNGLIDAVMKTCNVKTCKNKFEQKILREYVLNGLKDPDWCQNAKNLFINCINY